MTHRLPIWLATAVCAMLIALRPASAVSYRLVVETGQDPVETVRIFTPLAAYLSAATGLDIKLAAPRSFLAHWRDMRKKKTYDLVLDAAHFTGYRVGKLRYHVLAKAPGVLSFSIVTGADTLIFETDELIGKRVATLVSPALGAVLLADLFPDPIRTPRFIEAPHTQDAVARVMSGKALAAVIPSPLVGNYPALNVVATTEQLPAVALSAADHVAPAHRDAIRRALLNAANTKAGRDTLNAINFSAFEPADDQTYRRYARLLASVWGY